MAEQIKQRIVLEGADAIQRQLEAIGKAGSEAFQKLQDASKAAGSVGADQKLKEAVSSLQQYNRALAESQKQLTNTGRASGEASKGAGLLSRELKDVAENQLQRIGISGPLATTAVNGLSSAFNGLAAAGRFGAIGIAGLTGGIALALPGLISLGKAASDAINALSDVGKRIGLNANEVNKFRSQLAGIGVESKDADTALQSIGKVLDTLYLNSVEAARGARKNIRSIGEPSEQVSRQLVKVGDSFVTITRASGEAGRQLKTQLDGLGGLIQSTLKIEPATLAGKTIDQVFRDVAAAIAKIDDEKLRRITASRFEDAGLKGITEAAERLREYGSIRERTQIQITEADEEAAKRAKEIATSYQQTWNDLTISLGASLQGLSTTWAQLKLAFAESVLSFSESLRRGGLAGAASDRIEGYGSFLSGIREVIKSAGEILSGAATGSASVTEGANAAKQALTEAGSAAQTANQQITAIGTSGKIIRNTFSEAKAPIDEINRSIDEFFFDNAELGDGLETALDDVDRAVVNTATTIEREFEFSETIAALTAAFESLWQSVAASAQSALSSVDAQIQSILSSILSAVSQIQSAVSSISVPSVSSDTEGFATGGYIRGRGTSTSDSILARLSNGEFVMRAAAVRKFGPQFFAALNSLRLPQFATGGLVQAMAMPQMNLSPSFELSGSGPSLRPLAVTIGGETFQMMAPEDTAQSLMRFATVKQIRSNGRKPSWHGG
jgi:hypothetical protein